MNTPKKLRKRRHIFVGPSSLTRTRPEKDDDTRIYHHSRERKREKEKEREKERKRTQRERYVERGYPKSFDFTDVLLPLGLLVYYELKGQSVGEPLYHVPHARFCFL